MNSDQKTSLLMLLDEAQSAEAGLNNTSALSREQETRLADQLNVAIHEVRRAFSDNEGKLV